VTYAVIDAADRPTTVGQPQRLLTAPLAIGRKSIALDPEIRNTL
jgi:hypothetical protein